MVSIEDTPDEDLLDFYLCFLQGLETDCVFTFEEVEDEIVKRDLHFEMEIEEAETEIPF